MTFSNPTDVYILIVSATESLSFAISNLCNFFAGLKKRFLPAALLGNPTNVALSPVRFEWLGPSIGAGSIFACR